MNKTEIDNDLILNYDDYEFVVFSDSGGDLHYVDDITDKEQLVEALKVVRYMTEVEGIDVWFECRYNPRQMGMYNRIEEHIENG